MRCENDSTKYTPLPELLSFIVDNRGKTVPTSETGHILIATNCIKNDALYPVFEKVRYLSDDTYSSWFRSHPKPGDIIFVNKGTPGRVCMVPEPVNFCIAQDMIALRTNSQKIYNKYLFAVLRSQQFQTQINNTNVGDVIPHFKKSFLDQLIIPVPSDRVQRIIGDIYYDLSDKIELNNRINKTLEEMAQAIFSDFIFRCDGPLMTISDVAAINQDAYSEKENWEFVNYLDTSNITCGQIDSIQNIVLTDEKLPSRARRKVKSNDIVYSTVRPNQRHFGLIAEPSKNMLVSTGFSVISSKCPEICNEYIYTLLRKEEVIERLQQLAEQSVSTYPSIKPSDIGACEIIVPSVEDGERIASLLKPIYGKIALNNSESSNLAAVRDTLLPRLMSGELSIIDLE